MKTRYLITLVFIFICSEVSSQTYYKLLNNSLWKMEVANFMGNDFFSYDQDGDTVINGVTYSKIVNTMSNEVHFMREDSISRKVYIIRNNSSAEVLQYDFSLTVGSSFDFYLGNDPFNPYSTVLTQIETVSTPQGPRRLFKFCLNCTGNPPSGQTINILEGVGSLSDPIEVSSTVSDPVYFFLCSYQNQEQTYVTNNPYHVCPAMTGIPFDGYEKRIKILTGDEFIIVSGDALDYYSSFEIFDATGKIVKHGEFNEEKSIAVGDISDAAYFIKLYSKDTNTLVKKFLKGVR